MRFPTTSWQLVDAVRRPGDQEPSHSDWNRFITAYWKPVFCYLRSRGFSVDTAEDLTQSFFARVWEKGWMARAQASRGRFRTFLLTVLKRFVADQGPNRAPRQSSFEHQMVAVSALMTEEERGFQSPENITPEKIFMHTWAKAVIESACDQLRQWCENEGRPDWYALFEATKMPSSERPTISQRNAASQFRITRDQVRHGLKVANEKFVTILREEVGGQVPDEEVEDEIRELENYLVL